MNNLFHEADVVFKYTRKQAIEDGVLVDITELAREAGVCHPVEVAVTRAVFEVLDDTKVAGQDFTGRAWDMLMVMCLQARASKGSEIYFAPLFALEGKREPVPVRMWSKCGPGDNREPVITIMLEGED
ncbi:hypothetical protein N9K06_00655 [Omnitrophica bacterium]|nr:hypothetical protein [Candidatus Omnitrophota bacterium]